MRKEIRQVQNGLVQVTVADERWYAKPATDKATGLPSGYDFVPSVTWISSFFPRGIAFYKWLANTGWDEAQAIKQAAGDKGSRVHRAIVDLIDGQTVEMDAKYPNADGEAAPLALEEYDCLLAFARWWETMKPHTLARELVVFNEAHGYAGTLDWIGMLESPPKGLPTGLWLLDWKTSQDVWPEHEIQVSAYGRADLLGDILADAKLPREALRLGVLQVGYRRNKQGWKLTPVEDQFDLFLAARRIWQKQCEGVEVFKRDYPLMVALTATKTPKPATEEAAP